MEKFKIRNFEVDNPLSKFPWFRSLSAPETASIRKKLLENFRLRSEDPEGMVNEIDRTQVVIKDVNANDDRFTLLSALATVAVLPEKNVYLNWYRFDQIDEIKLADLNKYFSDIWHAGADDIDIFDSSLSWIISISHEGSAKFVKQSH